MEKMRKIYFKFDIDFSFIMIMTSLQIIVARDRSTVVRGEKPCVFEGCACTDLEKTVYAFCINQQMQLMGFPKRNEHFSNSTEIGFLLISFYNFTTMPNDVFADLKVNTMFISNNRLRKIEKNAFRGMQYLNYISLDENISEMEVDAFHFVQRGLIWLSINGWSVAIKNQTYFASEIRKLTGLKRLSLQNISLTSLDKELLKGLHNLEQLDLSWNKIERLNYTAFEYTTKLKIFSIAYNNLTSLDHLLNSLKRFRNQLTDLELSSNKIRAIKKEHFESFINLKYLSLSDNRINSIEESCFANNTELQRLYLDKNYLKSIPNIFKLSKLYSYNISNQNEMLESIGNYAFDRENSQDDLTIHLGENKIKSIGEKAFCSRRAKTASIKAISLDYALLKTIDRCILTQIGRDNIASLIVIGSNSTNNYYLDVCNCEYMLFLSRYNVNLEGICTPFLNNLTCFNVNIRDDCADKPQYLCSAAILPINQLCLLFFLVLTTSHEFIPL
jgi:Leucine-rich repeat (LRR) protein